MKTLLITLLVFPLFLTKGFSQEKVQRYCAVCLHQRSGFTTRQVAELMSWKRPEFFSFRDTTIVSNLQKVNAMETVGDVLNYMSSIGWTLTGTTTLQYGMHYLYFKREFDASELAAVAAP